MTCDNFYIFLFSIKSQEGTVEDLLWKLKPKYIQNKPAILSLSHIHFS